ncbi:unnamed protein product [Linum tenue]|uniref:KIB1-4 beta-propeller domain-containing protein n=1 Tax=Linum tenue TaxID=586396 RepID=A0AAV0K5F3_9ROSI|nr:unnamed protein product [Linum tenue]
MAADWQNLPDELLNTIATKLTTLSANIRFTGVSRSWRLAGLQDRHRLIGRQIPGLILPPPPDNNTISTRKFIPLTEFINHHKKNTNNRQGTNTNELAIPWRLAERSLCIGWCRGWMLVLDYNCKLTLQNPLTGSEFALPEEEKVKRIKHLDFLLWGYRRSRRVSIGTHSVSVSDWFVVVVQPIETYLKYCRVGDGKWKVLEFPEYQFGVKDYIVDALCSSLEEGCLYVLMSTGELFCCDFDGREEEEKKKRVVAFGSMDEKFNRGKVLKSLVEVEGEILLVHENRECACGFDVYRVDRAGKRWVGITDQLGEVAVFLWFAGQPFSVRAEWELGIRGNCIYFLEMEQCRGSDRKLWCDIGVFDLKTSKIEFFHVDSELEMPCPGRPVRLPVPIAPLPW